MNAKDNLTGQATRGEARAIPDLAAQANTDADRMVALIRQHYGCTVTPAYARDLLAFVEALSHEPRS